MGFSSIRKSSNEPTSSPLPTTLAALPQTPRRKPREVTSIIEDHPQRKRVIDALLAGESPLSVSRWIDPPVSEPSIQRYRKIVVDPRAASVLAKVAQSQELTNTVQSADISALRPDPELVKLSGSGDYLVRRLARKAIRREKWYGMGERLEDIKGLASLDRVETADIELEAKLTGRLQQADGGINIGQVVVVMPGHEVPEDRAVTIDLRR
jgi:hypothetical protein